MDRKKDIILSVIALIIVVIGAIILCLMKLPAGLLIILPSAIPHIIRLRSLTKK